VADVQPFCGLRYNPEQIDDFSTVISPPYDVISKYIRAATTMESWLRDSILIREQHPAFYLVRHHFLFQNRPRSRFSLLARVRLEDLDTGHIRPHEMTMRGPAIDGIVSPRRPGDTSAI